MKLVSQIVGALSYLTRKLKIWYRRWYWLSRFGEAGNGITIGEQFEAAAPEHIYMGDFVFISNRVTLLAHKRYPLADPPQTFRPHITLRRGCFINRDSEISCVNRVTIGENVMIAQNCYIADYNHSYEDVTRSIKNQPLSCSGEVTIGDDTWIGVNCCILGEVRIGRHCVVGAHSVVTSDLPDFCVAVGAPARVVRVFDPDTSEWLKGPPSKGGAPVS